MPLLLSPSQQLDAANASPSTYAYTSLILPLVFLAASVLDAVATPSRHALLISALAWLALAAYATLRVGARSLLDAAPSQRLSWAAGVLLTLAQICERAVDVQSGWWAKALLPLLLYTFVKLAAIEDPNPPPDHHAASPIKPVAPPPTAASPAHLVVATLCGLASAYSHSGSVSVVALGCSQAVLAVFAFNLIDRASWVIRRRPRNIGSNIYSAGRLVTQPTQQTSNAEEPWLSLLRDVSVAGAVSTALAALVLDSRRFGGLAYYGLINQAMGREWIFGQGILSVLFGAGNVIVHMFLSGALIIMIQQRGALLTTFVPLAAALSSQLLAGFSISRVWFAVLCAGGAFSFLDEQDTFSPNSRMRLRFRKVLMLTAIVSFLALFIYYAQQPLHSVRPVPSSSRTTEGVRAPPKAASEPLQYMDKQIHPMRSLIQESQEAWSAKLRDQSPTLDAAVREYRRRYGLAPPPHFDKWYEFAKKRNVQLIDEYDTIYNSLLPFWALEPVTIRARAKEALGFGDNQLMGLLIRDGKALHVEGGQEWLQQAAVGMMEQFVEFLPDMDLAFNVHDEPRVVVPHDELYRMVQIALTKNIPQASSKAMLSNAFSARPKDLGSGKRIAEVKSTRFNVFAHQPTWIPSRLSCSPDSPARPLDESLAADNLTAYALGELAFVYNQTAFSDVCNSPSFSKSHGFFDRPNAFNVVHDLFPIFSQSKMSSFQDILYPSPWYWFGKVEYKESQDMKWASKENKLWWRGSTTGGFSRAGGWKRQHRQRFVRRVNALDTAKVLDNSNAAATDENPRSQWIVKDVPRQDYKDIMDVHFSHVGQCDPGDCDAQREFFKIVEPADQQDAWKYKYLLDLDGNAFSGRFYAFLMSHSLTFKMAVFREWHEEWIKPWVHYIPLSLRAEEALEAVRYLDAEEEGKPFATSIAEEGRDWAFKALRNEDFEAWLFRLLLEYGRIIDDNRDSIGYSSS